MRPVALLFFCIFSCSCSRISFASYTERECGCTYSKLWLDIVLLIDYSNNIAPADMDSIINQVVLTFGKTTINPAVNQTVRIAVANFARTVSQLADFGQINSSQNLETVIYKMSINTGSSDVNTAIALNWASTVFARFNKRQNAQKVIVLYSSAYSKGNVQDPLKYADQLKEQGVTIITIATNILASRNLSLLASPNNNYTLVDSSLNYDILNAFCRANCFCKFGFTQLLLNDSGHKYGECIATTNDVNNWVSASLDCSSWYKGSFLAAEFSSFKHSFILSLAKSLNLNSYFIGLSYNASSAIYQWQQPNGKFIALNTSYLPWNTGYPDDSYGKCVKIIPANNPYAQNMVWVNAPCVEEVANYICQMNTCDTDNYCATLNDYN